MSEIARAVEVWNPLTGELVPASDTPGIAAALHALREYKGRVEGAMREATQILVDESRRQGTKTLRLGDVTAEIRGGPQTTYDVEMLRLELDRVGCPQERLDELIKIEVAYRVDGRVARQLANANPDYARAIEKARLVVEKPYWAKVA